MMYPLRLTTKALVLLAFTLGLTAFVQAQPSRTWVSGTGDDFNPCSRTAPCKTFAGALSKTATNGEINCLNPGSYNFINITKSITIDCEDTQGGILASGLNGISINLGPSNTNDPLRIVRLRGLALNGFASGNGRGISVTNGNTAPVTVHLDHVVIDNFINDGIFFNAAGGELLVRNSVIQNCGLRGLMVDSSDATLVRATLENSTFSHNEQGIRAESAGRIAAYNCNFSHNSLNGVVAFITDTTQTEISLYKCVIANNRQWGVIASSGSGTAIIRLDGNHIVNNQGVVGAAGVNILSNGQVLSRGNNTISGNPVEVQGGSLGPLPNL